MPSSKSKILLAMSGGIDSTAAALLLKKKGYEVVGCTFTTRYSSTDSVQSAVDMAASLGIEHHVIDFDERFQSEIVGYFRNEYLSGRTPNPCVLCNKRIKFGALLDVADSFGCEKIATGHYARIASESKTFFVQTAVDSAKDQSYFLWMLTQDQLSRIIFPLGELTKPQVRLYLAERGYVSLSQKSESQDICFIPSDYRDFLRFSLPGNYVDFSGKLLGTHTGFANYTIGQRKGLGVALGYPAFVTKIDSKSNEVTLGHNKDLLRRNILIDNCILHNKQILANPTDLTAKIRYRSKAVKISKIEFFDNEKTAEIDAIGGVENVRMRIEFAEEVWGVTPGQSLVIYRDDLLVAGGIIKE